MNKQKGFSLIELMTVLAIVGILAVIALTNYLNYTSNAANKSCLAEVKGYTNVVMVALGEAESIPSPTTSACDWITDASVFTSYSQPIAAYPVSPGDEGALCSFNFSSVCSLNSSIPETMPPP
ncbi:pilin [Marinobacterium stanieri]|uniref:pilin n=1 Tax=Marinobacterium stanieri TaxID=49186 RepID=UPI003A8DC71C